MEPLVSVRDGERCRDPEGCPEAALSDAPAGAAPQAVAFIYCLLATAATDSMHEGAAGAVN